MFKEYKLNKYVSCSAAIAILVTAVSCSSTEDKAKKEEEKNKKRFEFLQKNDKITASPTGATTISEDMISPKEDTISQAQLSDLQKLQINSSPEGRKAAALKAAGKTPKSTPTTKVTEQPRFFDDIIALNGDEELAVSLIFNSAPMLDVLSAFADLLGFNFVADSSLKSVITLNLNSKMTRREIWNTFERMINIAGATARMEDSLIRIVPNNRIATQPDQKVGQSNDNEILYFPLKTITAREAMLAVRQFLSPGAITVDIAKPNAILVCDNKTNIPKIKDILEHIDINTKRNWPKLVYPCRNILPSKAATELQEVLPVIGFNVARPNDRNELPGSVQLVGLDRLGVIIASAATQEAVNTIREWLELLDSRNVSNQERVFVYKVRHNKAAHLAQALAVIYDTNGASLSIDSSTGRTRMENINTPAATRNNPNTNRTAANSGRSIAANIGNSTKTDKESNIFENKVKVFADGVLNRLVIRTTARTYASIKALLDRLDVVPAQVLLQVLVVEVTLTESTQFGLEFSGLGTSDKALTLFGTNYAGNGLNPFTNVAGATGTAALLSGSNRQDGGTFVIANPNNPLQRFGYIRALAGNSKIKVLSSPQLMVSSHTEANIKVGSDVPVLSSGITNTASAGTLQQDYRYVNTGIILTVTPQITSTNLISLDVKQELSKALEVSTSSTIKSPEITQRVVETSMTIANGQTMVIGGLIQEKNDDNLSSLPIINKIPILNRLFGNTSANVERTEILMLITGYIVNEHSPVEEMIKRYNDAIKAINDFDSKLGNKPDADKKAKPAVMTKKEFWL